MPSDDERELPLQKRREMTRKPGNVTLSLPTKSILTILAASCTKLKLVTKLFKAVGADLNDDSLNISTIRHQKKYKGETDAKGSEILFHPLKNLITHSWFFILMER